MLQPSHAGAIGTSINLDVNDFEIITKKSKFAKHMTSSLIDDRINTSNYYCKLGIIKYLI